MDFEAPIEKVITIIIVASVAPIAMTAFNAMNTTGFTATQITIVGIMGLVIAFVFLRIIMKEWFKMNHSFYFTLLVQN